MTPEEATTLCRLAKAAWPSMPTDEWMPDAWALALDRERFVDAEEALRQLMREQRWLHVSDIVTRVGRIRNQRIVDYGPLPEPVGPAASDPALYVQWRRDSLRRIADGTQPSPTPELAYTAAVVDYTGAFQTLDRRTP